MSAFDPFSATVEQAIEAEKAGHRRALQHFFAALELTKDKEYFEAHPLDGMERCAIAGLAAPDWLAMSFLKACRLVRHHRAKSWDDAFGKPHPKGVDLTAKRRARRNLPVVIHEYQRLVMDNPRRPIDNEFWTDVGQAAGVARTNAQKLWKAAHERGWALSKEQLIEKHHL